MTHTYIAHVWELSFPPWGEMPGHKDILLMSHCFLRMEFLCFTNFARCINAWEQNMDLFSLIPCHIKYSQSEYRKMVVHSVVLHVHPTFLSWLHCTYVALIVLATVFSMEWFKIVTHWPLGDIVHGISHKSLVFSSYTYSPKSSFVYQENASDSQDISWSRGRYLIYPWVGRCGTAPHTLTLFKTNIADFLTLFKTD